MDKQRSYLSIDIGSQHTRAWLFDCPEDQYRVAASSEVDTTLPGDDDVQRGVWTAVEKLQASTGHPLLDHQRKLILNNNDPSMGVDKVSLSISAGRPIRTALIALTEKATLSSIQKLAGMFYCEVVLSINLTDGMDIGQQLQSLMQVNPDLVILAGGVEGGASLPIISASTAVRLFYQLTPGIHKPQIIFAGNSSLVDQLKLDLEAGEDLHITENIRPGNEIENLEATWPAMLAVFARIRMQQIRGLQDLVIKTGAHLVPSAFTVNRMISYLNLVSKNSKGVMAINVGEGQSSISAAKGGRLVSAVSFPQTDAISIAESSGWSSVPMEDEITSFYLQSKVIHPAMLPATIEDLAIEQAWARVKIQHTLNTARRFAPEFEYDATAGLVGAYEPIIISGSVMDKAPTLGQAFLMGLDGIQPSGITTFLLDREQILTSLGSIAEYEPLIPVQILDSGVLQNLGTVVCVQSPAREGALVLKVEIAQDEGGRELFDVRQGTLKRFELPSGTKVRLYLAPEYHADIGMGERGLGGWVALTTGELGVVIDARGRRIQLPDHTEKRSAMIKSWLWELGG
jgi:hypothetical protein